MAGKQTSGLSVSGKPEHKTSGHQMHAEYCALDTLFNSSTQMLTKHFLKRQHLGRERSMLKSQAKEMEREERDMRKPEDRGEPILSQQQNGAPWSLLQWNTQKQLQVGGA